MISVAEPAYPLRAPRDLTGVMGDPSAPHLSMAVGEVNITPRWPPWPSLWMGGYGWGRRGNLGAVARELRAQCVVIYDDGVPNVLVRIDTVTLPRDVHQAIRARVVDEGLAASPDFVMMISHTHSGPFLGDTNPDPFVMMGLDPPDIAAVNGTTNIFQDKIVDLVRDTVAQVPTPVTLGYAKGSTEIAFNRAGLDTVLTDVPVLLAKDVDGNPFAVLFGYACHPVSRGNDIVFDSDYCGRASEVITDRLGVPALFFQGTAGDHDPMGDRGPDRVVELGDQLADAVLLVIEDGRFTPVTGPIRTDEVEVQLPYSVDLTDPAAGEQLTARYEDRVRDNPAATVINRHAEVMLRRFSAGELGPAIPMPIQCWRLGGLSILALAHEAVSDYQVEIEKFVPGPVWVMAYANEVACYVPVDRLLWAGGYEAGWIDDPHITGDGTSQMAFTWPAPLRASPQGGAPAAPGSIQRIVLDACRGLLLGTVPPVQPPT